MQTVHNASTITGARTINIIMKNFTNVSDPSNSSKAPTEPTVDKMLDNKKSIGESENKKKAKRGTKKEGDKIILPFPISLHDLLDDAEKNGKDDIVSFFPDGKAFTILKPKEFTEELMPLYFKTKKIASFQRQLLLYGFKRIVQDYTKLAGYYHEFFIKGQKVLSLNITRQRQMTSASSNPAPVPNPSTQRQQHQQQPRVSSNNAAACKAAAAHLMPHTGLAGTSSFDPSMINMWSLLPSHLMQPNGLSGGYHSMASAPNNQQQPQFGESPLTNIYLQAAIALQQQKMTMMTAASSDMTDERLLVNAAVARAQFQDRQRIEYAANAAESAAAASSQSEAEAQAAETLANIFSNPPSSAQHNVADDEEEERTQNIESV
jgi:hypothetical protein